VPRVRVPASDRHALIHAEAAGLIGNRLTALPGRSCRAMISVGIQPKVRADCNVRTPDITVTCEAPNREEPLQRAPLLLIDIHEPEEAWANVWAYTTIPSVCEILVLHAADIRADLLRREEAGTCPDNPLALTAGR
jgi:hypothetical protein